MPMKRLLPVLLLPCVSRLFAGTEVLININITSNSVNFKAVSPSQPLAYLSCINLFYRNNYSSTCFYSVLLPKSPFIQMVEEFFRINLNSIFYKSF
jgi:hypothetical protein